MGFSKKQTVSLAGAGDFEGLKNKLCVDGLYFGVITRYIRNVSANQVHWSDPCHCSASGFVALFGVVSFLVAGAMVCSICGKAGHQQITCPLPGGRLVQQLKQKLKAVLRTATSGQSGRKPARQKNSSLQRSEEEPHETQNQLKTTSFLLKT